MSKTKSKRKTIKSKEFDVLKLWNKKKVVLTDMTHVVAWGSYDAVNKKMIREHYGQISFNLDFLEDARQFFKSIHHDSSLVRCYIPKTQNAAVIFVCESAVLNSKKEKPTFYAIAPRLEEYQQNTKEANGQ